MGKNGKKQKLTQEQKEARAAAASRVLNRYDQREQVKEIKGD